MTGEVDVTAIAVSWNTSGSLRHALDSLAAACAPLAWEAVVVDNGSTDGSVEWLSARDDVRLIALDHNTGFTHAANVGAEAATGRLLLFLNPDVIAPPGSIAALVDAFDADPVA